MTMQNSNAEHSGFFTSVLGQITVMGILLAVILLIAWRYMS